MSDREKVFEFMKGCNPLFLSTVKSDKPKCRPLGFRMLVDNQIYFLTLKSKDLYEQMLKNASVEFVGLNEGKFLRYYGRVIFDDDEDKSLLNKALEIMPQLEGMVNADTPIIFHVDKATAEIRNMGGVEETYNFLN